MEMNLTIMFFVIFLFVAILGFCVGLFWGWTKLKTKLFNKTLFHFPKIEHRKELELIFKVLPVLSFDEKLQIIQQVYGRPIRIVSGCDRDGSRWIEMVTYYTIDEEDKAFHFEKSLKEMTG